MPISSGIVPSKTRIRKKGVSKIKRSLQKTIARLSLTFARHPAGGLQVSSNILSLTLLSHSPGIVSKWQKVTIDPDNASGTSTYESPYSVKE